MRVPAPATRRLPRPAAAQAHPPTECRAYANFFSAITCLLTLVALLFLSAIGNMKEVRLAEIGAQHEGATGVSSSSYYYALASLSPRTFSADAKSWSNTTLRFYTKAGHRYAERTRDSSPFQDPDLDGDGRLCGLDEFEQLAANHFGRSQESSHYDGVTIIACTGEGE